MCTHMYTYQKEHLKKQQKREEFFIIEEHNFFLFVMSLYVYDKKNKIPYEVPVISFVTTTDG